MYSLKLFESLISLSWTAVVLVISILGLLVYNSNNTMENRMLNKGSEMIMTIDEITEANKDNPLLVKGKELFKSNCATCHNRNMTDDLVGPALAGVTERWVEYPTEDLYSWIRNAKKLFSEKHPMAIKLFEKWDSPMTAFPNLKDEEIEAILAYVER